MTTNAQWLHLDTLIRSWLYGVINSDLLAMVMDFDSTAHTIWVRIEGLLRDNAET